MAEKPNKPKPKTAILADLSEKSGVSKKEVTAVLDALEALIAAELGKKGPGIFTLPGQFKIMVKTKKKQDARVGRNPQTGEPVQIPAKPARKVVRVTPLKKLKDLVK